MHVRILLSIATILLAGCAAVSGGGDAPTEALADVEALADALEGEYTNHAQVWASKQAGEDHPREFHLTIVRDPSGTSDRPVLRLRQVLAGGDGRPVRDARLVLETSPEGGVTQRVQERSDGEWRALNGCEIHWQRGTSGFHGATRGDGCRFRDRRNGRVVTLHRRWTANADSIELVESRQGVEGTRRETLELAAVRWYQGWAGVRQRTEGGRGGGDWRVERRLRLHDGGAVRELPDAGGGQYAVRLERLKWPNSGIEMLRLSVVEPDSGEVLAYSWAPPRAERIGIHLGWLQAGLQAGSDRGSEDIEGGSTE